MATDKSVASMSVAIGADISGLSKGLKKAEAEVKKFAKSTSSNAINIFGAGTSGAIPLRAQLNREMAAFEARSAARARASALSTPFFSGGGSGGGSGGDLLGDLLGKKSFLGRTATLLRGGGAIAGLTLAGKAIDAYGEKVSELADAFVAGTKPAAEFAAEVLFATPAIGGLAHGLSLLASAAIKVADVAIPKFIEAIGGDELREATARTSALQSKLAQSDADTARRRAEEFAKQQAEFDKLSDAVHARNKAALDAELEAKASLLRDRELLGLEGTALERKKLEQELRRAGVSGTGRTSVLLEFDRNARSRAETEKRLSIEEADRHRNELAFEKQMEALDRRKEQKKELLETRGRLDDLARGVAGEFAPSQTKNAFGSLLGGKSFSQRVEQKVRDEFTGKKLDDVIRILETKTFTAVAQ